MGGRVVHDQYQSLVGINLQEEPLKIADETLGIEPLKGLTPNLFTHPVNDTRQ
jgi:hypothetical protein